MPMLNGLDDGKEFTIVNVVIEFGGLEQGRVIGDGVFKTIILFLG